MPDKIHDILTNWNVPQNHAGYLSMVITVLMIALICIVANLITKRIVLRLICHYIKNNKFRWDNVMMEKKVFSRLANIIPAMIIYFFAPVFAAATEIIQRVVMVGIYLIMMLVIDALLNSADDIYRFYEVSKNKPIKGYLQVVKIIIYIFGSVIIIASLLGQNPVVLLGGLGALSAVLLIIFKDSLLGLVAGVLISTNDMLRIGDWIEMPKYGADGDVVDVTLHTVKVENFDRTITTIPSYALISDSFKNWRGMVEAGGRRIKRAVYVDIDSIKLCSEEMLSRFEKSHYLSEYIMSKRKEIEEYNDKHNIDDSQIVNGRRMTNIGTFRAYIQNYLKNHPKIHQNMIQMVRQLPPGEHGLPIEIYVFTNDIAWVNYEAIQADIFDHILAVAPYFELRLFQEPTGYDMREGFAK